MHNKNCKLNVALPKQGELFEKCDKIQNVMQLLSKHSYITGFEKESEKRQMKYDNWHLSKGMKFTSTNDIPTVNAYNGQIPNRLTRFNELSHCYFDSYVHFFLHDYVFNCLWSRLEFYTLAIAKYRGVIAPDYSMFVNVSKQVNIQSLYRNNFISSFWQNIGISVVPSVTWGNADSFDYCLEGKPKHSVLAIGSVGMSWCAASIELFKFGISQVIQKLEPTALLIYGNKIAFDNQEIPVYYYEDFINSKFRK